MFIVNEKFCEITDTFVDLDHHFCVVEISTWTTELDFANKANSVKYLYRLDVVWAEDTQNLLSSLIGDTWEPYSKELAESMQKPILPFNLIDAKNKKSDEIDSWRFVARYVNVFTTVSGVEYEWQADTNSQQLISNSVVMAINGIASAPPVWRTFDNIDVLVTLDDLKTIANTMVEQTRLAYYHSFELKAAVDAATTQAELDAITW
jgi:hypothetical protein